VVENNPTVVKTYLSLRFKGQSKFSLFLSKK